MPNCLVQQLMPINGLTTRGDLIAGKIIPYLRGEKKTFSPRMAHARHASHVLALSRRGRADLLEQLRVETAAELNVVQGDVGLPPLRVNDGPLPQSQRLIGENQGDR